MAAPIDTEATYPQPFRASWTLSPDRMMMGDNPELGGAIMDIVVWLRSLGLGKYEAAFRENEITRKGPAEPDGRGPEGRWPQGHRT